MASATGWCNRQAQKLHCTHTAVHTLSPPRLLTHPYSSPPTEGTYGPFPSIGIPTFGTHPTSISHLSGKTLELKESRMTSLFPCRRGVGELFNCELHHSTAIPAPPLGEPPLLWNHQGTSPAPHHPTPTLGWPECTSGLCGNGSLSSCPSSTPRNLGYQRIHCQDYFVANHLM